MFDLLYLYVLIYACSLDDGGECWGGAEAFSWLTVYPPCWLRGANLFGNLTEACTCSHSLKMRAYHACWTDLWCRIMNTLHLPWALLPEPVWVRAVHFVWIKYLMPRSPFSLPPPLFLQQPSGSRDSLFLTEMINVHANYQGMGMHSNMADNDQERVIWKTIFLCLWYYFSASYHNIYQTPFLSSHLSSCVLLMHWLSIH